MDEEPTALEIADVLDKAHDELLVRGWTQFRQRNRFTGAVCAIGALSAATGYYDDSGEFVGMNSWNSDLCIDAEHELRRHIGMPVSEWNDAPQRTVDEVFDAFKSTAKRLREEAGAA